MSRLLSGHLEREFGLSCIWVAEGSVQGGATAAFDAIGAGVGSAMHVMWVVGAMVGESRAVRWTVRGAVIAAVLCSMAEGAAAAAEPTVVQYWGEIERRESAAGPIRLDSYFGDAEILLPPDSVNYQLPPARPAWRLENAARVLDRLGAEVLSESLAAEMGAARCRLTIVNHSVATVVTAVLLSDGAEIDVRRTYGAPARFVVTGAEGDLYAAVCADALFTNANIVDVDLRPDWFVERIDTDVHKVLLTSSPVSGPIADAVRAMLESVRNRAPRPQAQPNYFPDLVFAPAHAHDQFHNEDLGPLLDEERIRDHNLRLRWYTRGFVSLDQPSLYVRRTDTDAVMYRITRLPSFSGPSSVTVVVNGNGDVRLDFRVVGPPDPDCLNAARAQRQLMTTNDAAVLCGSLSTDQRDLDSADSRALIYWLDRREFWDAPTAKLGLGFDGCQMLTEALVNGRYHVVDRWICDVEAPPEVRALLCRPGAQAPDGRHGHWPPLCETP